MLKELKLTSQKGDATLVLKQQSMAGLDGSSVVHMSIKTTSDYIGAGLTLEDVKALVKPGAGVRETPFSRRVYVGGTLAAVGYVSGEDSTRFHYPAPWAKTRQTIIDWLNAAIAEFDTKKEPPVAITPTSHTITDSDGHSVTFSASGKGGVKLEFRRRPGTAERGPVTLDAYRSKALVEALRKASDGGAYTTIRPGGSRPLDISAGWIDGPISVRVSASEHTAAADFVEKLLGLSTKEPEAVVEPVFKFAVGDRVKIVAPARGLLPHEEVGQTGVVTRITKFGGFDVRPDRGTAYIYAPEALESVKDEPKFKVGDRVKIVGNPTHLGRELPEVGREGTVKDVDDTFFDCGPQFKVKPTEGVTLWYSASALEKIIEAPAAAKVEPTPVKTAVPVFGPLLDPIKETCFGHELTVAADIRKAAEAVLNGFSWASTPEGHEFWSAIHDRLEEMAEAAEKTTRRPDADYKSPCPVGYETLAMAMLRRGKPDDATAELGGRVSRKAADRGIPLVWVEAPAVAGDVTTQVRAYHRPALDTILAGLGIPRA